MNQFQLKKNLRLERYGIVKPGDCLKAAELGYKIVRKISTHMYEMRGNGISTEAHAIVETKDAVYDTPGIPAGLGIRRTGSKQLPLENGFSTQVFTWKECIR